MDNVFIALFACMTIYWGIAWFLAVGEAVLAMVTKFKLEAATASMFVVYFYGRLLAFLFSAFAWAVLEKLGAGAR